MKVFISWSGDRSKKIALIFRDWLPLVIQSLKPFVSSEDLRKGSRWSVEIAQELQETSFGLICLTKENLSAPWLNFEAGALSKTIENAYVAAFWFDVKPSDLTDLPIIQFQGTPFNEGEIRKLLETLNGAAGNNLTKENLDRLFNAFYPELEKQLKELSTQPTQKSEKSSVADKPNILEELLEISRNTQRLLGDTDVKIYKNIEQIHDRIEEAILYNNKILAKESQRYSRDTNPVLLEKLFFYLLFEPEYKKIFPYNFLIILGVLRNDFPWLYDAGIELVNIIQSTKPKQTKIISLKKFESVFKVTTDPIFYETTRSNYLSIKVMSRILPDLLRSIEEFIGDEE